MRSSFWKSRSILSSLSSPGEGNPLSSLSVESSTFRNLTELAKSLMGLLLFHYSGCCSVFVLDLERLNRLSMSSSVMIFFFWVLMGCGGLLLMVLLSLAVLFFQSWLELMARRMWETSVVRVASVGPSLFLRLRFRVYLLCINDYYYNYNFLNNTIHFILPYHPLPRLAQLIELATLLNEAKIQASTALFLFLAL